MGKPLNVIENENGESVINTAITKLQAYKVMLKEYPDVLNIEQVSMILSVCTKTAYKLLREQKIEFIKIGRVIRIPKISLLTYLKVGIKN